MKQNIIHPHKSIADDFKPVWTFYVDMEADLACYSHHLQKVERVTYPMPTATAMVASLSTIYWHAPIRYRVDEVHIINPVKYQAIMLNERPDIGSVDTTTGEVKPVAAGDAMQRTNTYLRNPHYQIKFTMLYDAEYYNRHNGYTEPGECYQKHVDILARRLKNGQSKFMPYAGLSECRITFKAIDKFTLPTTNFNASYMGRFCVTKRPDGNMAAIYTRYNICNGICHLTDNVLHVDGLSKDYTIMDFLNSTINWKE